MPDNWNILGHEWAVELLRQQVAQNATRNAYLFAGPPGVGRLTLALRFAQALNCQEPIAPGEPCGKCRNCLQIARMEHPDLQIVVRDEDADNPWMDPMRKALHTAALRPYQSPYRVMLFPHFHEATPAANNALLKTLEEAPSFDVLILTADSPEQLLPTIVSRCELLRLRPVPLDKLEAFITGRMMRAQAEGKELPGAQAGARLIAHVSAGRPGYAVRLLEDPSALALRAEVLADLQSILSGSRAVRFSYAEKYREDREVLRGLFLIWLSFWRDVLLRAGGAQTPPANIDHAQEIDALAKRLPLEQARRLVSKLEQALGRLDGTTVNARLLTEVLLLDWPKA